MSVFSLKFNHNCEPFNIDFQQSDSLITLGFDIDLEVSDLTPYDGSYTVIPKVNKQVLETKGNYMKDDVTVVGIPYYDVSNTSGGSTVYIANELEVM